MIDLVNEVPRLLTGLLSSPWLWAALLVAAALDALLPFMPSEAVVVAVGVLVHPSWPQLVLLIAVAAAGAFGGDCLGYLIGRRAGPRLLHRMRRGRRGRDAQLWAARQFARRGELVLVAGRHIPGVRMASMLSAGILGYPVRRFLLADAAGVLLWAGYASLIGFFGGAAFTQRPWLGMLTAFAMVAVAAGAIELGRRMLNRRVPDRRDEREPVP